MAGRRQPRPETNSRTGPDAEAIRLEDRHRMAARADYASGMDQRVLQNFLGDDGRLRQIPTKHSKLLVVLDHLSQSFEPGRRYPESGVNEILTRFHPDYAALRRYLAENG